MVNAGRLGRKSGRGFFDYSQNAKRPSPRGEAVKPESIGLAGFELGQQVTIEGVQVGLTDGRMAREVAGACGTPVLLYDWSRANTPARTGFATSPGVPGAFIDRFVRTLQDRGRSAVRLPDWPGLVVMRTVAMVVNEAFEAVLQGVATEEGVGAAMMYGVNYPKGPFDWARQIGLDRMLAVIDNLNR